MTERSTLNQINLLKLVAQAVQLYGCTHLIHHLNADKEETVSFGRTRFSSGFQQEMISFG